MSLRLVKHEPSSPMERACSSKEMERKSNYFRKHLSFSFAKVSKAESCFAMTRTGKSTHLSTSGTQACGVCAQRGFSPLFLRLGGSGVKLRWARRLESPFPHDA